MTEENMNKSRWLAPAMNGSDDEIAASLLAILPTTASLSAADMAQMDQARNYMAELFLRGISSQDFRQNSGLTGFPVDPMPAGAARHELIGKANPAYFKFWLVDKDPVVVANAIKEILQARQAPMAPEHQEWFIIQLVVDVDSDDAEYHGPLEVGITPRAAVLEFRLSDAQSASAEIEQMCRKVAPLAHSKVRVMLASFGQQEYEGMSKYSLFSKRIPYRMGSEWLMFRNIQRRAGRFAWFWQLLANRRNRTDK